MTDPWTDRWNERYKSKEFVYGKEPNTFLKAQLEKLEPGSILFAAEGEGRNGVFAATLGWEVWAFDISKEGRKKALQLAEEHHVTIDYQVGELTDLNYEGKQFDAIALIYAHFPAAIKSEYHRMLNRYLRPGGTVIFEAFSKNHINFNSKNEKVGGPKDVAQLFSIDELQKDFPNYDVIELVEEVVDLQEGIYHSGRGSVIRFVGRKQ